MTTKILALVLPILGAASSLEAQTPADWTRKVKVGKAIFVTTVTGEEIAGKAGPVAPGTIMVLTPAGPRLVPFEDIQRVQKHDRPWTGAVVGGAFATGLALTSAMQAVTECPPRDRDPACKTDPVARIVTGIGVGGALIGWGLDVLVKKRKTIYDRQRRSRAALVINARMVGLAMTF